MLPPRTPLTASDFAPKLQSQTLPAPEAGLSRAPLKPQSDSAARWPATAQDAPLRSSLLAQDLSKGHFHPRTLLPSPTFPRAQLQKQLLASTLHTLPPRSARGHLSAPPFPSSPRLGRGAPRRQVRRAPSTHKTPQASAARLHPSAFMGTLGCREKALGFAQASCSHPCSVLYWPWEPQQVIGSF